MPELETKSLNFIITLHEFVLHSIISSVIMIIQIAVGAENKNR